jgi:hypothetical protein
VAINLIACVVLTIALNIPFGSYRMTKPRFSLPWWLAIHAPIPIVVIMRNLIFNLPSTVYIPPWQFPISTIVLSIAAAVLGQVIGSRVRFFGEPFEIETAELVNDQSAVL